MRARHFAATASDSADFQDRSDPRAWEVFASGVGIGVSLRGPSASYSECSYVDPGDPGYFRRRPRLFRRFVRPIFSVTAAYYAFRNVIDQIVSTVRQQFYLVQLDRALIGVQEESVRLLESQLQDQQNRFEAGTVPRFNVLQAQVALSNQIPQLITARNNYRIAQLQLAKTLGLDFDPNRGDRRAARSAGRA